MQLSDITDRASRLLQDRDYRRWELLELQLYVEDAQQEWLRLTEYPRTKATLPVNLNEKELAIPENISSVKQVRLQGMQMRMITSSALDEQYRGEHPSYGTLGWRHLEGTPVYLVQDERTQRSLPIVPYPTEATHLSSMTNAAAAAPGAEPESGMLFVVLSDPDGDGILEMAPDDNGLIATEWYWEIEGVISAKNQFRDENNAFVISKESVLPAMYAEALVYGCLERAYYKENELRNLNKSQLWRSKFLQMAQDCQSREGQNALSHTTGANQKFMSVPFPKRSFYRSSGPVWSPQTLTVESNDNA